MSHWKEGSWNKLLFSSLQRTAGGGEEADWAILREQGSLKVTSNGTLHERGEVVKDFTPECGGNNRGDTPRVPKAQRGGPKVDPRRVIKDIFPSFTPDNDIVYQFKTSSAAGG